MGLSIIYRCFESYFSNDSVVIANGEYVDFKGLVSLLNNKDEPKDIIGVSNTNGDITSLTFSRQLDDMFITISIIFNLTDYVYPFSIHMYKIRHDGERWQQGIIDSDFRKHVYSCINDMISKCDNGIPASHDDIDINYIYKMAKIYVDGVDKVIDAVKNCPKSNTKSATAFTP